ncbi:MAG: histidine triad nucleotide-binding protein, partial [Candidatus Omnitrophica bacterium]|nr:histidine triad nucleotide-binding protein [Candidatus Omnitrophota bacterium]
MPADCLFCKIVRKGISADIILETDSCAAFKDINPQAPSHFLVIPKKHIQNIDQIDPADTELLGDLLSTARQLAIQESVNLSGYRLVINCNSDGGQSVDH